MKNFDCISIDRNYGTIWGRKFGEDFKYLPEATCNLKLGKNDLPLTNQKVIVDKIEYDLRYEKRSYDSYFFLVKD